jgi:hypothetical protein
VQGQVCVSTRDAPEAIDGDETDAIEEGALSSSSSSPNSPRSIAAADSPLPVPPRRCTSSSSDARRSETGAYLAGFRSSPSEVRRASGEAETDIALWLTTDFDAWLPPYCDEPLPRAGIFDGIGAEGRGGREEPLALVKAELDGMSV